ncbi:ferredoxin-NADP reductase [Xylophilus sp. Leaf220]|nr:ferredoxin-NADP reductase [Xylophilus sp. Leaf220]
MEQPMITTPVSDTPIATDALIVGAGPAGLFQAFELGLLGIRSHIVDALPHVGGQCIELYPDKPIYDIPALAVCTGRELVTRLEQQAAPFEPVFHLGQEVSTVVPAADGSGFAVGTSAGTRFDARTILLAAGVGAFTPRRLKIDGLEAFEGTQVFHRLQTPMAHAEHAVLVVGGDDAALEAAVALADAGARVTLAYRREPLPAGDAAIAAFQAARDAGALHFQAGQVTGIEAREGRLTAAVLLDSQGETQTIPLDAMYVLQGLSPRLGPIADWGLALARKQVPVDTESFATAVPGIYAVGDINTYPGKKKLILSAFHECTLAAFGAAARVFPGQAIPLQYTTTSTRLHQLLGVAATPSD